ncbi:MAG: CHAT domain-containing protein [Steroidobacteraceae bacterium]
MLVCACLLAACRQAGDFPASTPSEALKHSWVLLQRAHDEVGPRSPELREAGILVTRGLEETRGNPLEHNRWLEAQWFYYLLNDDHARARDAIAAAREAAIAAQAGPDRIADLTCTLSYSLILLGEVAQAKEYLRTTLGLASGMRNRVVLGDLYFSLGDAYRKTGERLIARRYFEAAQELDRTAADESLPRMSELKLGSLAHDAGAYQEAAIRHGRALAGYRRDGSYRELVTQIELARDHAALHNFQLAEQYATAALHDRRALLEQQLDAKILLLRIANDRRATGEKTPGLVPGAAALVSEIESTIGAATTKLDSKLAHPTHQVQFHEQAIRHYALDAQLDKVHQHGTEAIDLVNRVAAGLRATNDDSLAWLSNAQPALNEYVNAVYRLNPTQPKQVFAVLETYYGQPVAPRALEKLPGAAFDRYRDAQQKVIDATAEFERLQAFDDRDARNRIEQLGLERLLFDSYLTRDAYLALRATEATPAPVEQLDLAAYQPPPLPASDVVIRYFVQEQVSFGVVLGRGVMDSFELPKRSRVSKLIEDARQVVESPVESRFDRTPLLALAKELLPPALLARYGDAKRLILVTDDAMQPVPFAAIDIAAPQQPYSPLGARFEIVRTKSATRYYADIQSPAATAAPDIAIFANPLFNVQPISGVRLARRPIRQWAEGLPSLPNAQQEAEQIAYTFRKLAVKSYLGEEATNAALLSPEVRAARILHIATHGYVSSSSPDLVGLATSPTVVDGKPHDGFLGLTELFTEPFASRLVVISGCETMRGQDYAGWGVRSFADGFLTQGAGSVVGTLWSVSDDATAALMASFYRELSRNNGNSSLALLVARRALIGSPRFNHPYYWAGVVLESANRSIDQQVL